MKNLLLLIAASLALCACTSRQKATATSENQSGMTDSVLAESVRADSVMHVDSMHSDSVTLETESVETALSDSVAKSKIVADSHLLQYGLGGTPFESFFIKNKRLFIEYNQPVEGFKVTVLCFPLDDYDLEREHEIVGRAILNFRKGSRSFNVFNEWFSDSLLYYVNDTYYEDGQVIHLDYLPKPSGEYLGYNCAFFFQDMDFDGKKELVINKWRRSIRGRNLYDVYKLEYNYANDVRLLTEPPFNEIDDVTRFDSVRQTITLIMGSAVECYERTYQRQKCPNANGMNPLPGWRFELIGARAFCNDDYKEYVAEGDTVRLVRQTKGGYEDFWNVPAE